MTIPIIVSSLPPHPHHSNSQTLRQYISNCVCFPSRESGKRGIPQCHIGGEKERGERWFNSTVRNKQTFLFFSPFVSLISTLRVSFMLGSVLVSDIVLAQLNQKLSINAREVSFRSFVSKTGHPSVWSYWSRVKNSLKQVQYCCMLFNTLGPNSGC